MPGGGRQRGCEGARELRVLRPRGSVSAPRAPPPARSALLRLESSDEGHGSGPGAAAQGVHKGESLPPADEERTHMKKHDAAPAVTSVQQSPEGGAGAAEPRGSAPTVPPHRQPGLLSFKTGVRAGGGPGTGYEGDQDNEPALRASQRPRR